MTAADRNPSPEIAVEVPWYDLLPDPEPPEDSLQQEEPILKLISILKARYANDPTILCCGPLINVIYDSSVPNSFISPDGFIVFGLETDSAQIRLHRRSYRIDEWGRTPAFVLEVASESTANRDVGIKRDIYARIGVQEYWRLDLLGEYYGETLVGETLVDGEYRRFELRTEPNGDLWSRSQVLGVDFVYRVEDGIPRFMLRDSATAQWLLTLEESEAARLAEQTARLAEQAARLAAEARAERLQTELDSLRRQRQESGGG